MLIWECLVILTALYLGARIGGIGIGLAGGFGLLLLILSGLAPGKIPFDVIEIVMAVTVAIAALQAAGGMDYLVQRVELLLQHHPKRLTLLAPLTTYGMTLMTGTGYIALSLLPVIVNVAKAQGIPPSRPLSLAVIASQIAVTASPLSAAVLFVAALVKPYGIDYLQLISIALPATLVAVLLTATIVDRLGDWLPFSKHGSASVTQKPQVVLPSKCSKLPVTAKYAVWLFALAISGVIGYAVLISEPLGYVEHPLLDRNQAILIGMFSVATLITLFCQVKAQSIIESSTFKAGMSACVCILGVAWLGDTIISNHLSDIQEVIGVWLQTDPWLLAVILFFASMLLYSQAATAKALLPAALAIGVTPNTIVSSFAAVSALFVLPTYPTLLAAVAMDDTGSTRIGRFIFNHPFFMPGVIAIILSVCFSFLLAALIL